MAENALPAIRSVDDMSAVIDAVLAHLDANPNLQYELEFGRPSGNPIQLGPRLPDADTMTAAQIAGSKNAATKWLTNTLHPKKNFKEEALKPSTIERYHNSMDEVLRQKLWEGGMGKVNETAALAIVQARGASAYSSGVEARASKIAAVNKELYQERLALAAAIDAMPSSTPEQREAKMIANKRGQEAIGRRRRGAS